MCAPLRWGSSFRSLTASSNAWAGVRGSTRAAPAESGEATFAIGPHPAVDRGARHLYDLAPEPGVGLGYKGAHEGTALGFGQLGVGRRAYEAVTEKGYVFGAVHLSLPPFAIGKPCN